MKGFVETEVIIEVDSGKELCLEIMHNVIDVGCSEELESEFSESLAEWTRSLGGSKDYNVDSLCSFLKKRWPGKTAFPIVES